MKRPHLLLSLFILLAAAQVGAVPIDVVVPASAPGNTGAQMSIIASGLGSPSDIVRFPGPVDVSPVAWGTDWVRVRVPETWSGEVVAYNSTTAQWTDPYDIEITFSWSDTQWVSTSNWMLNSSGVAGVPFSTLENTCNSAYSTWECSSDFNHTYQGTTALSSLNSGDGQSVLQWVTSGRPNNQIAICVWRYDSTTGDIGEFDITFNAEDFTWGVNGEADKMDVASLAAHELGHSIGFLDQYGLTDFNETMYGIGANGETFRRTLHLQDVVGAEWVYGHAAGRGNMTFTTPSGWYGPITPRNTSNTTSSYGPLPSLLNGYSTTYLNFAGYNNGGDCLAPGGTQLFSLDGSPIWDLWWSGVWGAGISSTIWSNYDIEIKGGLHTFELLYDRWNDNIESNEGDNHYEEQFAYTTLSLLDNIPVTQATPPDPGYGAAPNTDGYRHQTGYWSAVGVMTLASDDDYDVYVYDSDQAPLTGFRNIQESSYMSGKNTDFIVVNGNVSGYETTYNAGIVRYAANTGSNAVIQASKELSTTSVSTATYGAPTSVGGFVMGPNDILRVHEVYLSDPAVEYGFWIDNISGQMDLAMAIYGPDQAVYNQFDYSAITDLGHEGMDEYLSFQPSTAGYYAVVVYKPTSDSYGEGGSYEFRVGRALANLTSSTTPSGWSFPIVPRNSNDATYGSAVLPSTLIGNSNTIYMNIAREQQGPGVVPPYHFQGHLDGMTTVLSGWYFIDVPPSVSGTINHGPYQVRGGRHTISSEVDQFDDVWEYDEGDNIYEQQFVWSPLVTAKNTPVVRLRPPDVGTGVLPNMDGFQYTPAASHSWVIAQAPTSQPSYDFDLVAYTDYSGSTSGFSSELARSEMGGYATDFIVGHFTMGYSDIYPAVIHQNGTDYFSMDQSDADGHRAVYTGSFLGESLGANQLVQIYSSLVVAGQTYSVTLRRTDGSDAIAFEVFNGAPAAKPRGTGIAQSVHHNADLKYATFTASTSSWYPIVVYRTDGGDAAEVVKYDLEWVVGGNPTAAPGEGEVSQFSFAGAQPNPAPGHTMLSFALPVPGQVQLDVFDLRGRRVRSVVDERLPAGQHQIAWDGKDARGRATASGTYYLRLKANGEERTQRMTIVR